VRPRLLDLYSCAGGAAVGYARAGFDVVGVDIRRHRNYPYEHHVSDALEYLRDHGREFDAIHASPPCQKFTKAGAVARRAHLDLLTPTRAALEDLGLPFIIENVPGAPMASYVTLCGSEFGLRATDLDGTVLQLRRHRQFESNVFLMGAGGCRHDPRLPTASVYGNGTAWKAAPEARRGGYVPHKSVCAQLLGIDHRMTKRELSESIPPAYTEFLGRQLLAQL
jgi:DNA (cytosine-5)-methyltransferase 1